ncbi:MAG: recombination mediator RecR [Planctomycetota bacterium]
MARSAGEPGGRSRNAYPEAVDRLIGSLSGLPGIGRRSAERLAFHLLKGDEQSAMALAKAVADVKRTVRHCSICNHLTDSAMDPCRVCQDERRDRSVVLVVEQPRDLLAIEDTGMWRGVYHVLLGRVSPLDGVGPEDLTVGGLVDRVRSPDMNAGGVKVEEVVLGLNPTLEGDGTGLYVQDVLSAAGVKVSRLARGLPSGSSIEYASKAVLAEAIEGRQKL